MKIKKIDLGGYNKTANTTKAKEKGSSTLPHNHLKNRAFMLFSCMLLNLAEVIANGPIDGLGGEFMWALVECLRALKIEDSINGVASIIQRTEWKVRDLRAALVQSAKTLSFGRLACIRFKLLNKQFVYSRTQKKL